MIRGCADCGEVGYVRGESEGANRGTRRWKCGACAGLRADRVAIDGDCGRCGGTEGARGEASLVRRAANQAADGGEFLCRGGRDDLERDACGYADWLDVRGNAERGVCGGADCGGGWPGDAGGGG